MTLQREGTGMARVTPERPSLSTPSIFSLARPEQYASQQPPLPPPGFEWTYERSQNGQRIRGWRLKITDLRGGLNKTTGDFLGSHTRAKSSTLDARFLETLVLPQYTTLQSTLGPALQVVPAMYYANVFGLLHIATNGVSDGSGNDVILVSETSATSPTIVDTGYDPGNGNHVTCLSPIVIGGTNNTPKLGVGNTGGSEVLASNYSSTSMDSALDSCWGMINVPLPDAPLLFYAGAGASSIYTMASSAAISATPDLATDGLPSGGYFLGLLGIGGSPVRLYLMLPAGGDTTYGGVYSVNLYGRDLQRHFFPLRGTYQAAIVRDGIVGGDGQRIVFWNGYAMEDLRHLADRDVNSDYITAPIGLWVRSRQDLYIAVRKRPVSGSGTAYLWIEQYDWDLKAWHQVSATQSYTYSSTAFVFGAGPLPISETTEYLHYYLSSNWRRMYVPPPGINPLSLRQTSGAGASTGQRFETAGTWTSPSWAFPTPAEYAPKVVDRIICGGTIEEGSIVVTAGGVTATFDANGFTNAGRYRNFSQNESKFQLLDVTVTINQGATTTKTPQALPLIIEGEAFLDEPVQKGWRWW